MKGKKGNMGSAIIIDDHRLFSGGLSHMVRTLDGIDEVLCFADPQMAIERSKSYTVSLVISDLYIPGFDMFVWFKKIRSAFPNAPLAVISSSISRSDQDDCLKAGADTYCEKHADPIFVMQRFSALLAQASFDDGFLDRTAIRARNKGLTNRQIDILMHLARGLSVKEISSRFDISTETVKTHLSNIYTLIGRSGRSAASQWARDAGLL